MSMINYTDLKAEVLDKYNKAKDSIKIAQAVFNLNKQAISNNIPNYDIKKLEFGAYKKDSFVSFFADMRGSSKKASSSSKR